MLTPMEAKMYNKYRKLETQCINKWNYLRDENRSSNGVVLNLKKKGLAQTFKKEGQIFIFLS